MKPEVDLSPPHESVIGFPPVDRKLPFILQLVGVTYPNPEYHHRRPDNNYVTVVEYVTSGSGFIVTDSGVIKVNTGDSYILHADEKHDYYSNPDDPWSKIWINISSRVPNDILNGYGITGTMIFRQLDISEYLNSIIDLAKAHPGKAEYVFDRSFIIFIRMCQFIRHSMNFGGERSDIPDNIVRLKNFLDIHIQDDLNLEKCAAIANLSVSQTVRAFNRYYKTTPYRYLCDQRFESAKTFLRGSQMPINDIARQLGFTDQYYFSAFFKKRSGKSPMEYREYQ